MTAHSQPVLFVAEERPTIEGMVDAQRAEIAGLLEDLTEHEARQRLVPSLTTVLGLVAHATFVEKVWFHHRVGGRSREEVGIPDSVEESFVLSEENTIGSVLADYHAACERSRAIAAEHELDEQFRGHHGPVSLRFIYAHMGSSTLSVVGP